MKKVFLILLMTLLLSISGWTQNTQPLNESFDSSEFPPEGWTLAKASSSGSNWSRNSSSSYTHTGSGSATLSFSSSNNAYLITPPLLPAESDSLVFYATRYYPAYPTDVFTVEISTTTPDVASFTTLHTVNLSSLPTTMTRIAISLEDYIGQTIYIAFHYNASGGCDVYIDDVSGVNMVVPSCPKPKDLVLTATTTSSITVDWTDAINSNWQVYYKNVSDTTNSAWDSVATSEHPFEITDLNSSTIYNVYVKADCGSDGYSDSLNAQRFMTACDVIAVNEENPYTASFPLGLGCFSGDTISGTKLWQRYDDSTITFPYSYDYSKGYLVSPMFDVTALSNPYLVFDVRNYASSGGNAEWDSLFVFARPDNTSEWDTLYYTRNNHQGFTEIPPLPLPISATMQFKFEGHDSYDASGVYVRNIKIKNIPCAKPLVSVASLTNNSATLNVNTENFVVDYAIEGSTEYTHITTNELTDLSANTKYIIRVAASCSENEISDSVTLSFTTPCSAVNVPYVVDFEDETVLNCWTVASESEYSEYDDYYYATTNYYPSVYNSTTYAHSPTHSLTIGGDYSQSMIVAAPKVNLDIEQIRLQFYVRKGYSSSYYDYGNIEIGLMTNPNDTNTFVSLHTIPETSITTAYSLQTIDFNQFTQYTGNSYYIAVKYLGTGDGYYSYCGEYQIDDITINTIPSCVEPSNLATSNITANSVDISWSSEASNFKVYYKDASASDEVEYSNVDATLTDGSYTLENLQPATTYKYYVATVCQDNSEANSQVYTFTTACATLNVPYTANFEDVANYARPNCWSFINSVTQSYSPYTAYPAVSSGSYRGHSSSKGLEFHSTSNESTAAIAVMPAFNTDLNQLSVAFWTRPESNPANGVYSSGRLDVGYVTDLTDASTFVIVDSISVYTLIDSAYHKYRVNFDQINLGEATTGYIAFRHVTNGGSYYWYLDDVTVEEIPACSEPTRLISSNATSSSIDLTWTSSVTSLNLYYKESSVAEYTLVENISLDENGIYTLENLQPNTSYDWKVGIVCSSDNQIYESETLSFTTSCLGITTVPQTWGFEADDNTAGTTSNPLPSCWTRVGSTEYPYSNTSTSTYYSSTVANTGSYALYFYNSGNTGILPPVETETLPMSGLQLSFYAKTTSSYSTATMEVGVMTDPTNTSTFTSVASFDLTTTYALYEVPLSAYTGTGSYIAFRTVTSPTMYVDDVNLDVLPACSRPNNVEITATADQATVSWASTGESFEIYYKESSAADYNAPITTVTTGEIPNTWTATISGLNPATAYDLYVKAICNEETQLSSSVQSFVTSCVAITTVPQTWGFEATGNTGGTSSYPLPSCWQRISGSSYTLYPYSYGYSSNSGTYSLYFYSSDSYGILPLIDTEVLPLNTLQLSLYAKTSSAYSNGGLIVGVMTDPTDASTFTSISTINLTTEYSLYEIPLSTYNGTGAYIALKSDNYSAVYADDVTLDIIPACSRPDNIEITSTTDQATVSWTSTGESFEIYYKENSEADYNTPITTATAGEDSDTWTAIISGLNPSTAYDLYVKAICNEESQPQSQVVSFRTECATITNFPYTEDFETLSTSDLGCWTNERVSGSYDWTITSATTGKVARRSSVEGSTRLISPVFDITSLSSPTLTYDYEACSDGSSLDSLYVYYRTSASEDWILLASHTPTHDGAFYNIGNPTQSNSVALPNASDTYQIAFLASCHGGYGVYLDNVVINGEGVTPVEPTVATSVATNIAQTTATLNGTITDAGNQTITAKGFEWKATNGGSYTQVLSSATGNTLTYNLTNLTANTSYTYKAFATTANGTVYGTEQVFTTLQAGDEPCTPLTASITETLCYGETFTFNGQTYNATGTYTTTVAGQNGDCDTNYTINLTILPQNAPINDEVTISHCELPYSYHGQTYTDFGTYTLTTQDENGCDQVYNLTLVHNSGISEVEGGLTISLYPNPTDNNATLRVKGLSEQATIIITDQQGRVVSSKVLAQGTETLEIETVNLASGVYYIRIQTANTIKTEKLIKK